VKTIVPTVVNTNPKRGGLKSSKMSKGRNA